MSDEEMEKFCAEILSAARKLGIFVREQRSESGAYYYEFMDPQTRVKIKGAANPNRKIALTNSCQTLVKYLDMKAA